MQINGYGKNSSEMRRLAIIGRQKSEDQVEQFEFDAELWLYPGKGGWHFVTLPTGIAVQIKFLIEPKKRGWGSEAVIAHTGRTEWTTSIFPDKSSGSFLLPVKAEVRRKEKLTTGQRIKIALRLAHALAPDDF